MQEIVIGKDRVSVAELIGKGGEGKVYAIKGHSGLAVKIYNTSLRAKREDKVRAMVGEGKEKNKERIGSIKALPINARSQFRPHPLARSTSISLNLDGIRCRVGSFSVISGAVAPDSPPIPAFRPQGLLPRPPGQQQSQWYGEFDQCRPNRPAGGGARVLGNRFGAATGVI